MSAQPSPSPITLKDGVALLFTAAACLATIFGCLWAYRAVQAMLPTTLRMDGGFFFMLLLLAPWNAFSAWQDWRRTRRFGRLQFVGVGLVFLMVVQFSSDVVDHGWAPALMGYALALALLLAGLLPIVWALRAIAGRAAA